MKRPPGRPPTFTGGFSRTAVRLRLSKAQWKALERQADAQGKSFREFLKMRLLKAIEQELET